jgi:outer membrane immunogenic protein
MRRLSLALLAAVSTIALTQFASAADLPVRAPVYKAPVMVPVYDWTGFYVGGNVGYSWGRSSTDGSSRTRRLARSLAQGRTLTT